MEIAQCLCISNIGRERERERKRDKGDRIGEREEILKWRNTELKGAGEMT